jgi:hypothetical protein
LGLGVNDNCNSPRNMATRSPRPQARHTAAIQMGRPWACLLSSCTRLHFNTNTPLCSARKPLHGGEAAH